ncbi:MAG: phosphoribosylformylglycinamidine synthase, partial [Acholeplasmataceae bacterium]|nr:phosphoribosylformylglycinamidine synthase [Acholeplasmataceae bacterium]
DDIGLELFNFRRLYVYEIFGCTLKEVESLKWRVFGERASDLIRSEIPIEANGSLAFGYLSGQFDQKADFAKQCIQLILGKNAVTVQTRELYLFKPIDLSDLNLLRKYVINPVDSEEVDLSLPPRIPPINKEPSTSIYDGFRSWDRERLKLMQKELGLAMSEEDIQWIQNYFQKVDRDPTETEIRVLDTYWSDHCRHTTFETALDNIEIEATATPIKEAFALYQRYRSELGKNDHPMTLMDVATIYAKWFRMKHPDHNIEISEEVNAASVIYDVEGEDYLVMFKNETHNHPTEIEPFGGASTCLGGAIRDPLSGRSVVYQGLRVTGAANVMEKVSDTIPGKLPQRVISKKAALGFSSYGNQIGMATTYVRELYHPGYVAKRMEVGAVVGAVRRSDVIRARPAPGDLVILVGGETGRDGIGGATGSSKAHTVSSLKLSSSEVQKGNPMIERKLLRLFSYPEVTRIIKKSNDFGAGGVAVAIGELAQGLLIDLDKVPTKYQGLSATELAISESQERLALVIDPGDYELLEHYASRENLTIHHVADVTGDNRLVMKKNGQVVVDIERTFIDTNGVRQHNDVFVKDTLKKSNLDTRQSRITASFILDWLKKPGIAMQKGMIEHFDSTIGRTTVLLPFGGKTQMTEVDASVQMLPTKGRKTQVVTIMTVGGDPDQLSASPYRGAYLAVVEALAKAIAVGGDISKTRLSLQEYFRRLGKDPRNWGMVLQALLGALRAQTDFMTPAIGGKDSMSGSYHDLHVPPTLLAFALTPGMADRVISPQFKGSGHPVYLFCPKTDEAGLPLHQEILEASRTISKLNSQGIVLSAYAIKAGGWIEAVVKMGFGNLIGFEGAEDAPLDTWQKPAYGGLVIETAQAIDSGLFCLLGQTSAKPTIRFSSLELSLQDALEANSQTFSELFAPTIASTETTPTILTDEISWELPSLTSYVPKVFIPVFPGTNCEMDSEAAFNTAGASTNVFVFKTQNQLAIRESIQEIAQAIDEADILMLSGGFNSDNESGGSGKYIAAVLLNPYVKAAIERLLARRGLILGICNGFQALIKSGLLPWGRLGSVNKNSPTLSRNLIGRHVSTMVRTSVVTNRSPWFWKLEPGMIHTIPVSHGEGRFMANQKSLERLLDNHQIATQYVDRAGKATMSMPENPSGSMYAIEGILSPDGLILGKMAHSERHGPNLYKNYPEYQGQPIFESAVEYLKRSKSR